MMTGYSDAKNHPEVLQDTHVGRHFEVYVLVLSITRLLLQLEVLQLSN